jgi:hypothetical protein
MNFALGMICGFLIGVTVMNLVHDWLDSHLFKDDEAPFMREDTNLYVKENE